MNVVYSIASRRTVRILSVNSLLDEWQNRQILKELQHRSDIETNHLVIDLAQMDLIGSAGINFLLILFLNSKKNGKRFALANASGKIKQLLQITKLSSVFSIQNSVEKAVETLEYPIAA